MKYNLKQETPILAIVALPFIYLAYLWGSLPEKVPIHWNIKGEIDGWGGREELILSIFLLPVLIYILFLVIPEIDPKKKLKEMGNKFFHLRFFMALLISLLTIFILYSAQNQSESNIKVIYTLIGFLIVGLGNYLPALRPNYFIGIKTPWALENETVWKTTHKLGGKLWFFGGALLTLLVLVFPVKISFIIFMTGVAVLTIVPVIFSYMKYKTLKKLEM